MSGIFMQANPTHVIEPLDQSVVATFKLYYVRRTFAGAVAENEKHTSLREFWCGYNIPDTIKNIHCA